MTDPTLATLIPSGTRRRNVAIVASGLLALALAGLSTRVLQPQIASQSWGAAWSAAEGDRTVSLVLNATPRAWPRATVTGVVSPPGTHVVGAWLVDPDEARDGTLPASVADGKHAASWREVIAVPTDLLGAASVLPQTVGGDHEVALAVVWHVDDCDALLGEPTGGDAPLVRWRTILGTPTTSSATSDLTPAGGLARDSLREAGVCP